MGWIKHFGNRWSSRIFTDHNLSSFYRLVRKTKNVQRATVLWTETARRWERSEENRQTGPGRPRGHCDTNNHSVQSWWEEEHFGAHDPSDPEADGIQEKPAEDHIQFHSCQPRTTVQSDSEHRVTEGGRVKIAVTTRLQMRSIRRLMWSCSITNHTVFMKTMFYCSSPQTFWRHGHFLMSRTSVGINIDAARCCFHLVVTHEF